MKIVSAAAALLVLSSCTTPVAQDPRLVKVAQDYSTYGRVHDRLNWAPTMCQAPPPMPPRMSISRDPGTHGKKLYYLYAKNLGAYRISDDVSQPVGQVLVKESWLPAAGSTSENPVAAGRGPLFLMMKTSEADADEGWIYATMTPDGKTITAAGKIASCMECHESKKDRLFGVKSCASGE